MSSGITKDLSSQYLKNFMRFRKQTIVEIAEHTGISKRTIQGYAQGNPPFRHAKAINFMKITDYMDIDPHYMLGDSKWKLSEFYKKICEEHNLASLKNVAELRDIYRLTASTRKYRFKKKRLRKATRKFKELRSETEAAGRNENTLKVDFIDTETIKLTFFVDDKEYSMIAKGGEKNIKDSFADPANISFRRRLNIEDTKRILEFMQVAKEIEELEGKREEATENSKE